ncbi:MAG TPA: APC family permease [Verrucomicrobiales bacterium]|nr:APC family permease [Verrucomicrobiales bacterium]
MKQTGLATTDTASAGGGHPSLRRDLGLLDAVGIGLGAVMGAGIFVVTGVAAGVAGPAFLVGLAVAGAAATFNGLSSAQLAALYPQSGGTYEYGYRVAGPAAGFAAGWMFLASKLAAAGTVALGFGHYASALFPGSLPLPFAAGAVVLLTIANLLGIRKAGALNLAIVFLTLLSLGSFVAGGIPSFDAANLTPFAPHGWRGVAESCALLFFAYTGYARLATLGEEVRDPEKNIPRAILLTLIFSFVIYLAVGLVAVGSVGADAMAATRSPLEKAAAAFSAQWVGKLLGVGAATAMFGVLLSQILGISRMMLAMARRGDLPAFFGKIDARHGVPARGIIITGAVALTLALAGTLEFIVAAAAFTILIYYAITNLCAIRLPREKRLYPAWLAWAGLVTCIAMASALPVRTMLTGAGLLLAGFLLRWCLHRLCPPGGAKN